MTSISGAQDSPYQALLIVSFGGPEGPEDVMPFLRNVTRGRQVPEERLQEVAEHYLHFGGVSPINRQNRALLDAVQLRLAEQGLPLPVHLGNRNWMPFLREALEAMREAGVTQALAFLTSMFASYSSCRQYLQNIEQAQQEVGAGAPAIDVLRLGFNHPGFIAAQADRVRECLSQLTPAERSEVLLVFTAHSIPVSMAHSDYELQLRESASLVAQQLGISRHVLVYQSRSGSPRQPWLEPDVCDALGDLKREGVQNAILVPIGFVSDHLEILWDLDVEALDRGRELGMKVLRAGTVGTHPAFVDMIVDLVLERLDPSRERKALGQLGPAHDCCPADCCPSFR